VDMERGYGGVREAAYWTRQLERAGAAMVFLTDFPQLANPSLYAIGRQSTLLSLSNIRDSSLLAEKSKQMLASPEEHAEIIKAICDSRSEMLVGIRTWAAAITGVDDAIRRLKIYRDAGADIMFAHGCD
jgi:2-methylisocitrate lyase-like PEP mutase family enzyme